jgi:hypothetical protein
VQAFRLKYFSNPEDVYGNPAYDTGEYQAGKTGLFYYEPSTTMNAAGDFQRWAFKEVEVSPTPISVLDSARNIDSDYGEILYTLHTKTNTEKLTYSL